ncbi:uncharacterized protein TNCV_4403891 [Trichonephila clavipes]|uniref:Uncharacterized protein n=1 Tax=Trichonephila clavipes TaxID=2585209 RepID=A0A8X6V5M1_TRICX|nr:uncharacterized protein TNCV_4403891 [Trichonephila clavipes]
MEKEHLVSPDDKCIQYSTSHQAIISWTCSFIIYHNVSVLIWHSFDTDIRVSFKPQTRGDVVLVKTWARGLVPIKMRGVGGGRIHVKSFEAQSPHVDVVWSTRGLLAMDHVILNHGQVTWTTPVLAPPLLTTPPHQRKDISSLDNFNVHRSPTRRVFSGTGLELVTRPATFRYLDHLATAATRS